MFRTHGDTKGTKAHKSAKAHNNNPATEGRCEYNSKNSVASVPNTRQAAATGAAPIHYRKQSHRAWRMNTHELSARGPSSNNAAARHIVSCMKCMHKFLFSEPLPLDQPTRKHPDNTHSLTTRLQAGATLAPGSMDPSPHAYYSA